MSVLSLGKVDLIVELQYYGGKSSLQKIVSHFGSISELNVFCHEGNILMLNVNLPYCCPKNFDSYQAYLADFYATCNSQDAYAVYGVRDFKARSNHFWQSLTEFCSDDNYVISDERLLSLDSFTYLSNGYSTMTWIHHCLSSTTADQLIDDIEILHQYLIYDHCSLFVLINCVPIYSCQDNKDLQKHSILNTSTG